jgi:glucosamine-6-phosphate deaminase
VQLILGKDFFYENAHPLIRATHGLIFLKEMNVEGFVALAESMKSIMERNK